MELAPYGICTLANDRVYDQLVALLNSIELQAPGLPVCIYPYDDRLDRVRAEVAQRPTVSLCEDAELLARWDQFVQQVWDSHPHAKAQWQAIGSEGYYRIGTHRRYGAFEGPFERFLYMDADTVLLADPLPLLQALDQADWLVYDFQFKDPSHVYNLKSPKLAEVFPPDRMAQEIFCSGFYAARRGVFPAALRSQLLAELQAGEAEILYPMAPDQTIVNYMVMRSGLKFHNLALTKPATQVTGCCITSSHFEERDGLVWDHGKPLTYLHYIGLSSSLFQRLCQGENLAIPYRETFLHYRYAHAPQERPQLSGPLQPLDPPKPWWEKLTQVATRTTTPWSKPHASRLG